MRIIVKSDKQKFYAVDQVKNLKYDPWHTIDINPYSPDRSLSQNNLLHMWCSDASKSHRESTGENYTPEAFKLYFKSLFLGHETIKTPLGEMDRPKKTSKLSQKKFAEFLTDIEHFCGSEGIELRRPYDYRFAMYGEK